MSSSCVGDTIAEFLSDDVWKLLRGDGLESDGEEKVSGKRLSTRLFLRGEASLIGERWVRVGWYGGEGVNEDGEESVEKEDVSSSKCN